MDIKIENLIPDNFDELLKDCIKHKHTFYTLLGGRGSTKSSFISIVIPLLIILNPDVNALITRKIAGTMRDSVYAQIQWGISKMGLEHLFEFKVSPMSITYKKTGQQIIFRGVDEPVKLKSLKCKRGYFGICWFEESAEFKPEEIRSVQQTVMRGGSKFWIFDSFNPPINATNWKNKEILEIKPNRLVHKSDYRTVPIEWLSQAFVDEAEYQAKHNEKLYLNEYLGEAVGSGDNVFDNIVVRAIADDEIKKFDRIYRGVDWGFYPDPFAYVEMYYSSKERTLYILRELTLHKHGNLQIQDKLLEFGCKKTDRITADSNENKSIADFRSWGWDMKSAVKGAGSVEYGFKWLQSLNGIVIDNVRTPKALREFLEYSYDKDKDGNVISGYPEGQADHAMACVRYALEPVWRKKGR